MCGIFASLSCKRHVYPNDGTAQLLDNRGPDSASTLERTIAADHPVYAVFRSTVLALRGTSIVSQPLLDQDSGSILCWNGEAWVIGQEQVLGNDSEAVFDLFLKACTPLINDREHDAHERMIASLQSIRGPYAFVYHDAFNSRLYFGRDCLGRRSLLQSTNDAGELVLSSICDRAVSEIWYEVEADGVYLIDLAQTSQGPVTLKSPQFSFTHIPYVYKENDSLLGRSLILPYPPLNRTVPETATRPFEQSSSAVTLLGDHLVRSLKLRLQIGIPARSVEVEHKPRIAILFSGGLDCTVLARLTHDILPCWCPIDLLNVAFENPRIHRPRNDTTDSSYSPYENCPDRITGRVSHAELSRVCPGRAWRFVEINVPYTETLAHRDMVVALMHPHKTEMDLSIAYALYFASRGVGLWKESERSLPVDYATPARVLLSGLGADELFGGYQRHPIAFARNGFRGLIDELELDINRLGKRNLGRDDRVISNWGKEVRFPYLDEELLSWALSAPVWEKTGFGQESTPHSHGSCALEPGKKVLRVLAWSLGMEQLAVEKKRAIQFGARTAKMETGKTKGTQSIV